MKVLLSLLLLIGIAGCGTGVPAPVWDITVITNGNGTGGFLSSNGTLGVIHNFGLDNSPIYRKNFLTGETHVVDATNQGVLSTGDSQQALGISADGRYVIFTLDAYGAVNLDPNAPAGQAQQTGPLFRKDISTAEIARVDVLSDGSYVTPAWGVGTSAISDDGNIVVFEHGNTEYAGISMVSGGQGHVYHKNLSTGVLQVVDITTLGGISSGSAGSGGYGISLSSDGSIVAFLSTASDLVGAVVGQYSSVYVRNMITGDVVLANAAEDGTPSNNNNYGSGATLSGDGNLVAFTSGASNLVNGVSGGPQLYVKNLSTGQVQVASSASDGTVGNGFSSASSVSFSENGRYIAFESMASNLVSGDTNNLYDIFVKDITTGEIARVSVSADGTQVDQHARIVDISGDGSKITFSSYAASIDPQGDNGSDIFSAPNPLTF